MRTSTFRRLVVLTLVLSLVAVTFTVKVIDNGNSAVDVDCKRYYYNQLNDGFEKDFYTGIENIKDFEIDKKDSKSKCAIFYVKTSGIHFMRLFFSGMERSVMRALQAAVYDMPLKTYFFHRYTVSLAGFNISCWPSLELKVKLDIAYDFSEKTKEWYDQQIIHQINNVPVNIDESATIPDKIMEIHKYVVNTLNYDHDNCDMIGSSSELHDNETYNIVNRIASVYNAFVGDHRVVCEGYAKMFKVLCDKYDIPCIVVTSDSDVGHMWNYVCIDNLWYIVDCTWDDEKDTGQTKVSTEYLMSGVDMHHQPRNKMNFKVPALSLRGYG